MKRFKLWLTTAIVFSIPALLFAQATGGSPGKQLENHKGAGTGRKGSAQPEIRKKGTGNSQRKTVTLNPQPLPPINHAPLAEKGSGNTPKTTGTGTVPPAGTSAGSAKNTSDYNEAKSTGKVYRKGSGTGRKGQVEQTDGGKKVIKGTGGTDKGKVVKPGQAQ